MIYCEAGLLCRGARGGCVKLENLKQGKDFPLLWVYRHNENEFWISGFLYSIFSRDPTPPIRFLAASTYQVQAMQVS
jgi:hypothetical protein